METAGGECSRWASGPPRSPASPSCPASRWSSRTSATETRFAVSPAAPRHGRPAAGCSVIIQGRDRPFGTLGVFSRPAEDFSPDDVHFLQAVANVLAAAIQRKRDEQELAAIRDELAVQLADMTRLHALSARLSNSLELPTVLEEVLAAVTGLQGTDRGVLMLYDRERDAMTTAASVGFTAEQLDVAERSGPPRLRPASRSRRSSAGASSSRTLEADPVFAPHLRGRTPSGLPRRLQHAPADQRRGARRHHRHLLRPAPPPVRPRDPPGGALRPPGRRVHRQRPALPRDPRGRPAQGRVPGDAGARAAQPPGARSSTPCTCSAGPASTATEAEQVAGHRRAAGPPPGPAGRRPARRLADQQRQDPAPQGAGRPRATAVARAVEIRPAADRGPPPRAVGLRCPQEPVPLEADAARLEQVLANLLNNAAKYTEPGGRIELEAGREGDEAFVRVRDTGIGIAPELLPRVFDLFTQAERSLDRSQGGLGIGLTLVRRLVELHGGSVAASSAGVGRGSEFVVRLPVGIVPTSMPGTQNGDLIRVARRAE